MCGNFRVCHGYTAGRVFAHRTRTRRHCTRGGYGYIPYPLFRSVMQNPRYPGYPRVRPPPTFLQPCESSTRTSIDVAARFTGWNGVKEDEEEEEEEGEWAALPS